jgi:hypothetical protein
MVLLYLIGIKEIMTLMISIKLNITIYKTWRNIEEAIMVNGNMVLVDLISIQEDKAEKVAILVVTKMVQEVQINFLMVQVVMEDIMVDM